jgi:hypothetical protein
MNLIQQIEVYRLATICGLYSKEELINFLDKIIANLDEPPYKIIEASLACNSKMQDALHIIKDYFYTNNGDESTIIKEFLHIICKKYQVNEITLEDSIYYLYNLLKETNLDNEIEATINYLSDGLFLAEQDIYGDVEDIKNDFIEFISKYS